MPATMSQRPRPTLRVTVAEAAVILEKSVTRICQMIRTATA
jgi:hypothetical protein